MIPRAKTNGIDRVEVIRRSGEQVAQAVRRFKAASESMRKRQKHTEGEEFRLTIGILASMFPDITLALTRTNDARDTAIEALRLLAVYAINDSHKLAAQFQLEQMGMDLS
jgi:hypothetical protein